MRKVATLKPRKITGRTEPVEFVVRGQPQSKANSRRLVVIKGKVRFIKSQSALDYEKAFGLQCPTLQPMFEGPVHVEAEIFYASNRPDLDESLILDGMQGKIYANDRQVEAKTIRKHIDPSSPRSVIRVSPLIRLPDAQPERTAHDT